MGPLLRILLLVGLILVPMLLAAWMKWEDQRDLANMTLPFGIYFVIFLLLTSVAAGVAWILLLTVRWVAARLG